MYPRNYAASDVGTTIRNPSTALLCIDSEDRFRDMEDLRTANPVDNPYDILITKNENLLSGFFTRLGVTEVVLPWTIPNINGKTDIIRFAYKVGAGPVNESWVSIPIGFYKPSQIASELQTVIRAIDPPNLGAFTVTYGDNNLCRFSFIPNNINVTIAFYPVSLANIPTLPTANRRNFWNTQDLRVVHQLFDILGLGTQAILVNEVYGIDTLCQFTRYVDIVSTQLTYNQALKDSSTSVVSRDVLCRLYLADGSAASDVAPSSPDFCPYGCAPFTIYRDFASPKYINWTPNQNVPGSVKFTLYADDGTILVYSSPSSPFVKSNTFWSLTLQVSEN